MKPVLHVLRDAGAAIAPTAGAALIRAWGATLRVRVQGMEFYRAGHHAVPTVFAFWHDQLLAMVLALIGRGVPYTVMISRHPDGDPIARAVSRLGLDVIRGSSTRGGLESLVAMVARLKKPHPADGTAAGGHPRGVIVIPDGPKGPRRVAKDGAVVLAQRARVRIAPLALAVTPAWRAGSWDRLQVPAPFARVQVVEGESLLIPTGDGERAKGRDRLQAALEAATARAERLLAGG